jgi:DNA-binding MarR family transcriptional regulator
MQPKLYEIIIAARSWGITSSTAIAVLSMLDQGEWPIGSIAHPLGLTTSSITMIADNLAALGFVQRRHEDRLGQDRRKIRLIITPAGTKAVHCITNAIHSPQPALASH